MPKIKNQQWDFENTTDRPTAERLAKIGKLNPFAYSMACELVIC
jgi:hypothetical protein